MVNGASIKEKTWVATDGKKFLDKEMWRSYERTLVKVPVSVFMEWDIRELTEVVFGNCYDIKGRSSQGMQFRYFIKVNKLLSDYNEGGIFQDAFDVAVECYSSPGSYSERRAKMETVILYTFSGVGNIIVVPFNEAAGTITDLKEEWKGRIYPVAPVLSFREMEVLLEDLGLNEIWNKKERPVNEMLFSESWKSLFTYEID